MVASLGFSDNTQHIRVGTTQSSKLCVIRMSPRYLILKHVTTRACINCSAIYCGTHGVLESSDLHSDAVIAANTEGVLKDEMLGYVTKQSPGKQKKRGEIYSDTFIVASAGVVLTETVSGIVAKQFTAEQERRGDRELDEARTLQQFSY